VLGILPIPDGPALMMLDDVATQQNGVKDCPELSDIFVNARHPRIRRACGRPQYGLRPLKGTAIEGSASSVGWVPALNCCTRHIST